MKTETKKNIKIKQKVFNVFYRDLLRKKSKTLRKNNKIPGSIFGPEVDSINIFLDLKDIVDILKNYGYNRFFSVKLENEESVRRVLLKELQVHPVTDKILSFGLYQVSDKRKINVDVPIKFIGEAPVEKLKLGFLVYQYDTIKIHCYPKDLPDFVEVDLSVLQNVSDTILVSSLVLPNGVDLDSSLDANSAIVYVATDQKLNDDGGNTSNSVDGIQTNTEKKS